ncbi:helix-turn-helix domain-containing protein [Herbiconiux sp. YIM B11900]|uniref:helix-turn-helix domain-containing protein n=1 Tax=Herbiconiux sp. YIM B11900 TaxID=3404131 RepID=UPI003F8488FD
MTDALTLSLAESLQSIRLARGLTVSALSAASGVSRAMIAKIEQGEAQPTAALLARLAGALDVTLSELIARAEERTERVARAAAQPVWIDPATGYRRRAISPPAGVELQLIEVELPPGARVPMPVESYLAIDQQIWVLSGMLRFTEGTEVHELAEGDCLQLGAPQPCEFANPTGEPCRYLVALRRR